MKKPIIIVQTESTGEFVFSQVLADIFLKFAANKAVSSEENIDELHSCDESLMEREERNGS